MPRKTQSIPLPSYCERVDRRQGTFTERGRDFPRDKAKQLTDEEQEIRLKLLERPRTSRAQCRLWLYQEQCRKRERTEADRELRLAPADYERIANSEPDPTDYEERIIRRIDIRKAIRDAYATFDPTIVDAARELISVNEAARILGKRKQTVCDLIDAVEAFFRKRLADYEA